MVDIFMDVYAMAREHSIVCFITLPKQNLVQTLLVYNFCLSKSWKAIISVLDLASSYYLSGNYRKMEKPSKKNTLQLLHLLHTW